jgi:hypothetical protein
VCRDLRRATAVSRWAAAISGWLSASFSLRWGPGVALVTADLRGVRAEAAGKQTWRVAAGDACGGSWCHGLAWRKRADEDQLPLMTVRTDQRLHRRHWLRAVRLEWRTDRVLRWLGLGRRLELQHLPYSGGVVALSGMPQAEIANLVEAARQHVLEEATHELVAADAAGSRAAGLAFVVLDADGLLVEPDDAGVGESDAKDVAGKVVEHRLFTGAPGGDVEDPRCAPHRVGDDEIGALAPQQCPDLATHLPRERLDGYQEFPPRRVPGAGVIGDPAAADQTMNMRVQTPTPTIP